MSTSIEKWQATPLMRVFDFEIASTKYERRGKEGNNAAWPIVSYKSSSHVSPYINVTHYTTQVSSGYVFLTPVASNHGDKDRLLGQGFVFDTNGDLVYAAYDHGADSCKAWIPGITDFRVQTYSNKSYITYWNGCSTRGRHWGYRWGSVTFVDDEYRTFTVDPELNINTMDPASTGSIDMHDHEVTDRGTIVVTSYNNTEHNGQLIADGLLFELDIATGEVLFEWHALEHLHVRESHYTCNGARPCDWMHLNSVQALDNNYLVSARHLFAIYLISGIDGSIIWKLDGTGNGTWDTSSSPFKWQHHARATNVTEDGMTVSLVNNNIYPEEPQTPEKQSQGLAYWISMPPDPTRPPILVRQLQIPGEAIYAITQGSYQFDVGNGNGFIGYGTVPKVREYGPNGDLLWEAQFGREYEMMSYRAFKQDWHGTPRDWDPLVVVESLVGGATRAYVSWNGATDVSGWAVYGGDRADSLNPIGTARKKGFETAFSLNDAPCVQVGAIRKEAIVRKSNVACLEPLQLHSFAQQGSVLEWLSYFALIMLMLPLAYRAAMLFRNLKYSERSTRDDQIGLLSAEDDTADQAHTSTGTA